MTTIELRRKKYGWGPDYPNDHLPQRYTFFTYVIVNGITTEMYTTDTVQLERILESIPEITLIKTGEW